MGHFCGGHIYQGHVMGGVRPQHVLTQERRKTLAAALATFHADLDD
jgi:riboflavin synthase alpha subunit